MGERSYYSAAVQSKMTTKSSQTRDKNKEKKNFKKVLLERKYQTLNMNPAIHQS